MTIHAVRLVGFPTNDPNIVAAPSGLDSTDNVTVLESDKVAIIDAVDGLMGITVTIDGEPLDAGDLLVVVGGQGDIPDYQVGMLFVVDDDGVAHFANAGHLAAAFAAD